jgi:hypothetical protein
VYHEAHRHLTFYYLFVLLSVLDADILQFSLVFRVPFVTVSLPLHDATRRLDGCFFSYIIPSTLLLALSLCLLQGVFLVSSYVLLAVHPLVQIMETNIYSSNAPAAAVFCSLSSLTLTPLRSCGIIH